LSYCSVKKKYRKFENLYIPNIDLPILPQENIWTDPGNI
jgi:hypothetical protein